MIIGITGGTSGLGKRLSEYLLSKGYRVKVLVRKTSQVKDLMEWGADLVYGDINAPHSLVSFIEDVNICYHIAAQVATSPKEQLFKVNVDGTKNICEAIIKYNPNCRLVLCSSIAVKRVHFFNRLILSSYTISKYNAEKIVDGYMKKHHIKASVIYPGYIYGPYDKNFMPVILKMLKQGLKFLIQGGEKNAPVVYVDDLCELFYLAGTKDIALGKKYVSLQKNEIGIHTFLKIIADKMNYPFPRKVYPKLPLVLIAFILDKFYKLFSLQASPPINMRLIGALSNKVKHFTDDACQELGWVQQVPIPEGIDKALKWQIENKF